MMLEEVFKILAMSCQTVAIPSYIPVIQMARTCCLMVVVVALQKKPQVHFGINLLTVGYGGQDLALTTHLKGIGMENCPHFF